jgi:hypothetical protein
MANIVPYAFPVELLSGTHNFASGGDTFKIALYTANPYTNTAGAQAATAYTINAEVSSGGGSQYPTGGNTLASQAVSNVNNVATVDFADSVFGSVTPATFTAAYATIYNDTNSDKLVVLLDFGGNKTCTNGTFTITFPNPTSGTPSGSDAIISITS